MTSSHGGFRYQTCILPACLAACTTGSRENIHRNTKRGSSPGRSLLFRFDVADEDHEEEDEEGKEEEGDVHISSGVSHSLSACLRVRACVCVCADMWGNTLIPVIQVDAVTQCPHPVRLECDLQVTNEGWFSFFPTSHLRIKHAQSRTDGAWECVT